MRPATLAVIPARGGSVGIPGKNLREVAGRSLLAWAVQAALAAKHVDEIVVTSDCPAILEAGLAMGVTTVERPPELATASASLDQAVLHCLDALAWDGPVVLLQPTVPFRPLGLVDYCISRLLGVHAADLWPGHEGPPDAVLTAQALGFVWTGDGRPLVPTRANRQDRPPAEQLYHEDGAVFAFRASLLRATGCRVSGRVLVIENAQSVDVDEPLDLELAETLFRELVAFTV